MFVSETEVTPLAYIKYVVWSGMICQLMGLIAGAFSFLGSFVLIDHMYSRIESRNKSK